MWKYNNFTHIFLLIFSQKMIVFSEKIIFFLIGKKKNIKNNIIAKKTLKNLNLKGFFWEKINKLKKIIKKKKKKYKKKKSLKKWKFSIIKEFNL
jgi:hypothetical protein